MLFLVVLLYSSSSEQRRISHGTAQIHNLSLDGRLTGRSFCHGISGPVTPKTADKVHTTPPSLSPCLLALHSRSMPTNADTQRTLSATTRPCHRSRRRRAPVQRCCPALHRREQHATIPWSWSVHDSSPSLVHTRQTHSHLPTPHRMHEGAQKANLTVSAKDAIKLITNLLFPSCPHNMRSCL